MLQVVNERYLHRRPMLAANKPLAAWGLVLHDPDLAEAMTERIAPSHCGQRTGFDTVLLAIVVASPKT